MAALTGHSHLQRDIDRKVNILSGYSKQNSECYDSEEFAFDASGSVKRLREITRIVISLI